jgi:dinuclear metal center YbgI/SA1388 family protein
VHADASLDDIAAFLDRLLDVERYRESEPDSNGLLFRSSAGPAVSRFAVAVNTSLVTIAGAAKAGAQLLVVHHTAWPTIDLHLRDEKFAMLEQAGISLYGAHASLDNAPDCGNSRVLATLIGVTVDATFAEYVGGHAGVIGNTGGTYADLIKRTSSELAVKVEAHAHAKTFGRVAICAGAGGTTQFMDEARRMGADTYLTGEGSMYTRMFARETGMNLIFGTHHATEAPGIKALGECIALEAQIPFEFIADSADVF